MLETTSASCYDRINVIDKDFFVDIFSAVGDIEKVILEKEKAILIFEDDDFDSDLALAYHESE